MRASVPSIRLVVGGDNDGGVPRPNAIPRTPQRNHDARKMFILAGVRFRALQPTTPCVAIPKAVPSLDSYSSVRFGTLRTIREMWLGWPSLSAERTHGPISQMQWTYWHERQS